MYKMIGVELEVMIDYRKGSACFRIRRESEGIFAAYLISFDGDDDSCPPKEITMVRSLRSWTGSSDDETLLQDLGTFIDKHWMTYELTGL